MRLIFPFCIFFLLLSCSEGPTVHNFSSVEVEDLFTDSVSIRAMEVMDGSVAFAGTGGVFGSLDLATDQIRAKQQRYDTLYPEFRAVAHTATDFFMLSAGRPALLFKTGNDGLMELVYKEDDKGVFYDSMIFWSDREGIAIGDEMGGCLSILITRDGGTTWNKILCADLPGAIPGEGAFAASNTNIAIVDDKAWIGTTEGRIYYSPDKGETWEVFNTPIRSDQPTRGIYSLHFQTDKIGIAMGGDYTEPTAMKGNKAITVDGGVTWSLVAEDSLPGYTSCVQFVPDSDGNEIVSVSYSGISYSANRGEKWISLSEEPFYTFRFVNDSTAYAAGKFRISKLRFK
ncbi:oxidoreductase [Muriicola soli]|uniref:Oxidoreductase n=2 Tax=Muriicola soli TaxID=2507538 RepID=A0A411EDD1_9FLAO|nr:oxidoreductase [Muriicola soli]QBA65632.1 oxidoreductase [Muriicola soli]